MSLVVTGAAASLGRLVVEQLLEGRVPAGEIAATDRRAPPPDCLKRCRSDSPSTTTRREGSHLVSNPERNKQVVVDYYTTAFAGNPERAVADHFGPRYIQHNPDAQDGPEAFIGFVEWLRGEYPNLQLHIKRVIAEGDLVATHAHLDLEPGNPDNPGRALADFFRLEDAKVVEHWDVIQEMPTTAANENGMF